jgi:hypothetical protein
MSLACGSGQLNWWHNDFADSSAAVTPRSVSVSYASPSGLDSNDGSSWETAKKTIYAALEALPGGATNPPTAGGGTVYVADGSEANPVPGGGIWLMGLGDPNYARNIPGWLRVGNSKPIRIEGIGCQNYSANDAAGPKCAVLGGNNADTNHPSVWISNSGTPIFFQNLLLSGAGVAAKLGISSGGLHTGNGVVNITFDNVALADYQASGFGPTVELGDNVFNVWFFRSSLTGNPSEVKLIAAAGSNGLTRKSNLVTVTTATNHGFRSGDNIGIMNASDPSFNGSFKDIRVTGLNTFSYAQHGPNAKSGGGAVFNDKAFGMVTSGSLGDGLLFFQNIVMNSAGVRFWTGSSGGNIYIDHIYSEGSGAPLAPALWIGGHAGVQTHFEVNQTQVADQVDGFPGYLLINDDLALSPDQVVIIGGSGYVDAALGPATVMGLFDQFSGSSLTSKGQQGIKANHLFAQTDAARSSPQSVRYSNLIPSVNTSWTGSVGSVAITNNQPDHDGGTNAAQANYPGLGQQWMNFGETKITGLEAGDIVICGAWIRSLATPVDNLHGRGFSGSQTYPLGCNLTEVTYTKAYDTQQGTPNAGDGEWEWIWNMFKVSGASGSLATLREYVYVDSAHPLQAYSPIAIRIPAETISDNEAYNVAMNLRGYLNACSPGMVCDTIGQVPHVNVPQSWTAAQSFGVLSINSETVSAAPRSEQNIFLSNALTSTWIASVWTPDKPVVLTRVQAQAKTAPSGCSANAVVKISDGSNAVSLTLSAAGNDSGAVSKTFSAGIPIAISVQTAATGCVVAPADVNVTLQYKMQ